MRVLSRCHSSPNPLHTPDTRRGARSAFRRFYERGDLPISVDHKSFKNAIKWKVWCLSASLLISS